MQMIIFLLTFLVISPKGEFINQIDGFLEPSHAVWLPDGNIAVADRLADELIIIDETGNRLHTFAIENPLVVSEIETPEGIITLDREDPPSWLGQNLRNPGISCATRATSSEIAEHTVRTLSRTIVPSLPGVVFLSGG